MVQEATAAGRSLSKDAAGLSRLIKQFQFVEETRSARPIRDGLAPRGVERSAA